MMMLVLINDKDANDHDDDQVDGEEELEAAGSHEVESLQAFVPKVCTPHSSPRPFISMKLCPSYIVLPHN